MDRDEALECWIEVLSVQEVLEIRFGGESIGVGDVEALLKDYEREKHGPIALLRPCTMPRTLKFACEDELCTFFEENQSECLERIAARYNGPPVEQTARDALGR